MCAQPTLPLDGGNFVYWLSPSSCEQHQSFSAKMKSKSAIGNQAWKKQKRRGTNVNYVLNLGPVFLPTHYRVYWEGLHWGQYQKPTPARNHLSKNDFSAFIPDVISVTALGIKLTEVGEELKTISSAPSFLIHAPSFGLGSKKPFYRKPSPHTTKFPDPWGEGLPMDLEI